MILALKILLALQSNHPHSVILGGMPTFPFRSTSSSTSLFSTPPTKQSKMEANERRIDHYLDPEVLKRRPKASSVTSTFWYSDVERPVLTEDEVMPLQQQNMDTEGPLPFGSYRTLGSHEFEPKQVSLLSIGLNFWNNPVLSTNNPDVDIDVAVRHAQKLIDSGFTTFNSNIPKSVMGSTHNMKSLQDKWIERNIFANLVTDTPSSVLGKVNLGTRIRVPSLIEDESFSPSKVRQIIGESIIDIYSETKGCLDSVELDVSSTRNNNNDDISPYALDILDVLTEMQREGLIRSISGNDFSKNSLYKIQSSGFDLDSIRIPCNVLDPTKYANHGGEKTKLILNSPLAGGILTDKFYDLENRNRDKTGIPRLDLLTKSELHELNSSIYRVWRLNYQKKNGVQISKSQAWRLVESSVIGTLHQIAVKHNANLASVAIRWAMQMDKVGSVSVGSSLNALDDNDSPFSRHRSLRKAFTFHLDEEDMSLLQEITGGPLFQDEFPNPESLSIDMNNKKLWL